MLFHVFFYFIHIFRLYSTLWAHLGTEIDGMVPIANTSFARKFISQMLTLIYGHLFQYVFVFWAFNHFFLFQRNYTIFELSGVKLRIFRNNTIYVHTNWYAFILVQLERCCATLIFTVRCPWAGFFSSNEVDSNFRNDQTYDIGFE